MLYSVLCLFHKEVILINALTPSFATTSQTRVYSVNCRNERGRRLRKDRILPAGVRLPVISSGTSTGVLMHGAPYYIVLDGDGNQLTLMGNQVYLSERFDTPAPEWVDKLNQNCCTSPGAVDPEEVNALVRSMEASGIKDYLASCIASFQIGAFRNAITAAGGEIATAVAIMRGATPRKLELLDGSMISTRTNYD